MLPTLATTTTTDRKRVRWTAIWAALKGFEALIGHLADRAKEKALGKEPGAEAATL